MIYVKTENGIRLWGIKIPVNAEIFKIGDAGFLCYKINATDKLWNIHSGPNVVYSKKQIVGSYNRLTNRIDFEIDEDWLKKNTSHGVEYFILKMFDPDQESTTLDKKESFISILEYEINKVWQLNENPLGESDLSGWNPNDVNYPTLEDYRINWYFLEGKVKPKKLLILEKSPIRSQSSSTFPR